jgi:hypothetical protein
MPAKRKKTTKKNRGLNDKELIKLLKKLKPKNQQIVRINMGSKDDKPQSKSGQVQTSYNPPFIIQAPSALPTSFPVPSKPMYESLKPVPLPMSQQPQLQPWTKTPIITTSSNPETESEYEGVVKQKRTYRRRQPETPYANEIERQFNKPFTPASSTLAAFSTKETHFKEPVINDTFFQVEISTDMNSDQKGVIAAPISSSGWTLSPDGQVASIGDYNVIAPFADVPPTTDVPETTVDETIAATPLRRPLPSEERPIISPNSRKSIFNDEFARLNEALISGAYDRSNIPTEMISIRGTNKGGLKRTGLKEENFRPIYEEYINSLK